MRPENWLESAFGSPLQIRLLRVLARDSAKSWTEREAATEAGLGQSSANLVFRRLRATGLLEVRKAGRSHLLRLHRDLAVVQRLIELFQTERSMWEDALTTAASHVSKGVAVYLFGSTARGDPGLTSDVDLLVCASTAETAEQAANTIRTAIRRVLPTPLEIIVLDKRASKEKRYKPLLENVEREGRKLTVTSLHEVFG